MSYQSIQEWFHQTAQKFSARTAIEHANRRVTYSSLEAKSNRLANYLLSSGVSKAAVVAILMEDPVEVITAIIATLKAGCVFVPLDPKIPEKRLELMISEVSPQWFIIEQALGERLNRIACAASGAGVISVNGAAAVDKAFVCADDFSSFSDERYPEVESLPDDMCYVFFTSGSTGRPKGIAGRLKGIDHFIRWETKALGINELDRVSQLTTPSFDAVLRDIFVPLCTGATLCAPPGREIILDTAKLIDWIDLQQISLLHCVPSVFRSILHAELNPDYFSSLHHVVMAGEALHPSDVKRWMEVYGDRVQLVNLYGPSETTLVKFSYFVKPTDKDRRFIPIGKPIEGAAALVVGANGKACPPGVVGEIYIRTPFRSLGYYNQPDLTKEVFIQNPFNDQDSDDLIYKTGDYGRILADGDYEFLGRKDQQVKIRGVRIELREIEDAIRQHETIADVAIIDREDNSGYKYLCAYLVQKQKNELGALKEFLSSHLPEYMAPSAFVIMDTLPRTISGKVDRQALPTPEQARKDYEASYVAPRTPAEEILADIWRQILGVPRVGIHDNFFVLGGHSLLAMQVLNRVRTAFGVELPLHRLFGATTVAELASVITETQVEQENAEELARMIEDIKQLSEDDLERSLDEENQLAFRKEA